MAVSGCLVFLVYGNKEESKIDLGRSTRGEGLTIGKAVADVI